MTISLFRFEIKLSCDFSVTNLNEIFCFLKDSFYRTSNQRRERERESFKKRELLKMEYFVNGKTHDSFMSNLKGITISFRQKFEVYCYFTIPRKRVM